MFLQPTMQKPKVHDVVPLAWDAHVQPIEQSPLSLTVQAQDWDAETQPDDIEVLQRAPVARSARLPRTENLAMY